VTEQLSQAASPPPLKDVAVVIPAYNEEQLIATTVDRVRAISPDWRIVVVDDGSEDNTAEEARRAGAEVIRHSYNMGNGSSVKTALTQVHTPVIAIVDADGQLPAEELPRMVQRLAHADMVVGARGPKSESNAVRKFGNWALRKIASYLTGYRIPDLTCGLRVFNRKRCLEFLHLYPSRFSFPTTSTLAFLTSGYRVEFHSISANRRPEGTHSKIQPLQDGLRFMAIIFRVVLLFQPWRIFIPASILIFLAGLMHQVFLLSVAFSTGDLKMSGTFIVCSISALFLFCFGLLAQQISEVRIHLAHIAKEKE